MNSLSFFEYFLRYFINNEITIFYRNGDFLSISIFNLSFPIFEIYTSEPRIKSIFSIKGTITTDNSYFVSYLCRFAENRQKKMGKLKQSARTPKAFLQWRAGQLNIPVISRNLTRWEIATDRQAAHRLSGRESSLSDIYFKTNFTSPI